MTASKLHDVIIIGGGPAGLGMGLALQTLGLQDFSILERHEVGASFRRWPRETRLITPSFNAHAFGYLDLNAIAPRTSPAYTLKMEHPDGAAYSAYLKTISENYALPVETGEDAREAIPETDGTFRVLTARREWRARFVVWAAGEFQYPRRPAFPGSELCLHTSQVESWGDLEGHRFIVIGGYESGMDAAIHLARLGKTGHVLERSDVWQADGQDPSTSLSPFTLGRLSETLSEGAFSLVRGAEVREVTWTRGEFTVRTTEGQKFSSDAQPILATGFESGARLIDSRFAWRGDGLPELTGQDESTLTPGLFLVGPSVRQGKVIFCFIYKFRQRFAVVARAIGERLGMDVEPLEAYRAHNMYLEDLSCCGMDCVC